MDKTYVLITAARNEQAYISKTIEAVISQSVLPKRWVIVSDGSTDRTDEIVNAYAQSHSFLRLLRVQPDRKRNFSSKVFALRFALKDLKDCQYDVIGNLDADVSFGSDYYAFLLKKLSDNEKLGVVGGVLTDLHNGRMYKQRYYNTKSVSGAVQTFRRKCFEEIGGYQPMKSGGEDTVAEVKARMNGWETRSYFETPVLHHRRTGMAVMSIYGARFDEGYRDAMIGNHPVYHVANCTYKMMQKPYIIGGILRLSGYLWALAAGGKRQLPQEFVRYLRAEQVRKLVPFK